MFDTEIDFDQDVHGNEHAHPSPVGKPPCPRAQIQESFILLFLPLDANANRMFSQGRFTLITLQE